MALPSTMYQIHHSLNIIDTLKKILDKAKDLGIDKITGGRAVISGNILSGRSDIFAANERGKNFLYFNTNGNYTEIASNYSIDDPYENGRGQE